MNVTEVGGTVLQNGADAMRSAKDRLKQGAAEVVDRAQDMAGGAWRRTRRAGDSVGGFAHRRPAEAALPGAAVAYPIAGLAYRVSRPGWRSVFAGPESLHHHRYQRQQAQSRQGQPDVRLQDQMWRQALA